jgi:hypothetical protein
MNLDDDVVQRCLWFRPLHQRHRGRSGSVIRHDDRLHRALHVCSTRPHGLFGSTASAAADLAPRTRDRHPTGARESLVRTLASAEHRRASIDRQAGPAINRCAIALDECHRTTDRKRTR